MTAISKRVISAHTESRVVSETIMMNTEEYDQFVFGITVPKGIYCLIFISA